MQLKNNRPPTLLSSRKIQVRSTVDGALLGYAFYNPGPVAEGRTAALKTPAGYMLRKFYYDRGGEVVRLEGSCPATPSRCFAASEVTVLGAVVAFEDAPRAADDEQPAWNDWSAWEGPEAAPALKERGGAR